ncbi:hypothetical protein Tco_0704301 [Tanacetum coccineum]|uniref:Uncharacterized protein n=1 Tax=Tanacetum coccineum TaxID=301880 RepID=A0ABQ4Y190_9ASTR
METSLRPLKPKSKFIHVQEHNVKEEVKSSGLTTMGDITFDQLMDEYEKKKVESVSGFKAAESTGEENDTVETKVKLIQYPLGPLQAEISSLITKVEKLESSLAKKVDDKLKESVLEWERILDEKTKNKPKEDKTVHENERT